MRDAFIRLIAASLKEESFTLVDIGCSGGIEPVWRQFGEHFSAIGFDASVSECRRLQAEETHPNVRYVAGFAGIPPDHAFAIRAAAVPPEYGKWELYPRSSAAWALEIRAERLKAATDRERMQANLWTKTELADVSKPIFVPRMLDELGYASVDFLKIDIDGPDFLVLNSFDQSFAKLGILGARLEVNFDGGPGDSVNTFHNTNIFMQRHGYALAALDCRPYAMRALPARFAVTQPAQAISGRILQADALYVRDIAAPEYRHLGAAMSAEKILKLAAVFAAHGQPDGAAEILLAYRDRLSSLLDVDAALDVLAAQTQRAEGEKDDVEILSYRDYMAAFASDSPDFYPPAWRPLSKPTIGQRLRAAFRAVDDWIYIDQTQQHDERRRMLDRKRRQRAKPT